MMGLLDVKLMCWLVMMHRQIIFGENCWIVGAEPLLHGSNQTQLVLSEGDGNFLAIKNN
jgi:hypothetical protein